MTARRLPTGLRALDALTGGLIPGMTLVVSADAHVAEAFARQLETAVRYHGGTAFVRAHCPLSLVHAAREVDSVVLAHAVHTSEAAYLMAEYADTVIVVEATTLRVTKCRAGNLGVVSVRESGGALVEG